MGGDLEQDNDQGRDGRAENNESAAALQCGHRAELFVTFSQCLPARAAPDTDYPERKAQRAGQCRATNSALR